MEIPTNIGKIIREKRQKQGLSIAKLAKASKTSATHLSRVETGKSQPREQWLHSIATGLESTTRKLLNACKRKLKTAA